MSDDVEPLSPWTYALTGGLWWASLKALGWGGVDAQAPRLVVSGIFMAVFGLACGWNGRQCGALHCRVSGPGYLVVALLAFASAAGWLGLGVETLLGLFVGVFAASYALELILSERAEPAG